MLLLLSWLFRPLTFKESRLHLDKSNMSEKSHNYINTENTDTHTTQC